MAIKIKTICFLAFVIFSTSCVESSIDQIDRKLIVYDGLVFDYINSNEIFVNQPYKTTWTKENVNFKGENYFLVKIGFETKQGFKPKKIIYINKEYKVFEYDKLNDSLIFKESYGL